MANETSIPGEMNLEDAIAVLLRDLPKPLQDFATGPRKDQVALALAQKYGLHVDQAGAFQRAYMFMLLGISSPEQFAATLREAGVGEATVNGLLNDVNEQVFKPLRKEEQTAPVARPPSPMPVPPPTIPKPIPPPTPPPAPPPAPPVSTPPPALPPRAALPAPPRVPAPMPPPTPPPAPVRPPTPRPAPPTPVLPGAPSVVGYEHPSMRTMASDMQAVKEHRIPAPEPIPVRAATPLPPPVRPAPVIVPPPLPPQPVVQEPARMAPPPANLPGVPTEARAPLMKDYSVDPYREPVE